LKYILTDVLGQAANGTLFKALKQDFTEIIQDILGLYDKVIDKDLHYNDSEGIICLLLLTLLLPATMNCIGLQLPVCGLYSLVDTEDCVLYLLYYQAYSFI